MHLISKWGTKGSITVEASIVVPIFVLAIASFAIFFNTMNIHTKTLRAIHESIKETIVDYSKYDLFEGIVEDQIKKEIFKNRFISKLEEELDFRKIEDKVNETEVDFKDLFNYGENDGYIKCDFKINGIGFSESIYLKALGEGVIREKEWEDVWHLEPMLRGRIIISRLGGNMDKYFELISRFISGEACVIKSIDPDLDSYSGKDGIYDRIAPYIERLDEYDNDINGNSILSKKIILVVPKDAKNTELSSQIDKLREKCEGFGIIFEYMPYGSLYGQNSISNDYKKAANHYIKVCRL